jgi:hypothetical protein
MKSNSLPALLLGLLAASALASLVLCWLFISNVRSARALQSQMASAQNNRAIAASLASDVIAYSKTHPDINPILEAVGLGGKPASNNPAVKPAGK